MHEPISLAEIKAAKERIAGSAVRTPLIRLNLDEARAEIYLKLENLQPFGSFKIRGAVNLLAQLDPAEDETQTATAASLETMLSSVRPVTRPGART